MAARKQHHQPNVIIVNARVRIFSNAVVVQWSHPGTARKGGATIRCENALQCLWRAGTVEWTTVAILSKRL